MFPKTFRYILAFIVATPFCGLKAQEPSPTPAPGRVNSKKFTDQQLQEIGRKLRERTGAASSKVMSPIQQMEIAVNLKYNYFRKPQRLDPRSYASKTELSDWQKLLQDFKDKEDALDKLYLSADTDLGNALIEQQITPAVALQIKTTIVNSFPWSAIKTKSQLMQDFIVAHGELLSFYDKNWDSWKAEPGELQFESSELASSYKNLKNKIESIGQRIDNTSREMTSVAT
jgi:hypothetical protein